MSFGALLDAALAGTVRQAPPSVFTDSTQLPPEARLLRGAGYEGLRRLAGRRLHGQTSDLLVLDPSPPETRPEVPAAAAARLVEILTDRPEVLTEWLTLVAARGARVPHALLPDLMDHAALSSEHVEDLVILVGGERLRWLAGLDDDSDWRFAAEFDPAERVALGTRAQRVHALRSIRRQDPRRGRELLIEVLATESGESRAMLLATLLDGLSQDDEPILEEALQDARKEVRQVAMRLIRGIPDSRFGQRWSERVRQVIQLRGPRFQVREPTEADATWIKDGLDPRPPKNTGRSAWLLEQLVALAPPGLWPTSALGAFESSDWAQPLIGGLADAALAYQHTQWTQELVVAWARAGARGPHRAIRPTELLEALGPLPAEATLRRVLDSAPAALPQLAPAWVHQWTADFSRYFIARLANALQTWEWNARAPLEAASVCLDPRVLPAAERVLNEQPEGAWVRSSLVRLIQMLEFRQALRRELA
jgi:Family of unknown function (DUF5691)